MALNIWHREDVKRILLGTGETMRETLAANPAYNQDYADAYRAGFYAALRLVAIGFGLGAKVESTIQLPLKEEPWARQATTTP